MNPISKKNFKCGISSVHNNFWGEILNKVIKQLKGTKLKKIEVTFSEDYHNLILKNLGY
jgi:hypothetical protein